MNGEKNGEINVERDILLRMIGNYPGLVTDAPVDGSCLIEWLSNEINYLVYGGDIEIIDRAEKGSADLD